MQILADVHAQLLPFVALSRHFAVGRAHVQGQSQRENIALAEIQLLGVRSLQGFQGEIPAVAIFVDRRQTDLTDVSEIREFVDDAVALVVVIEVDLHGALAEHDVRWFDVEMSEILRVHVREGVADLMENVLQVLFGRRHVIASVLLQDVVQRAAVAILELHEESTVGFDPRRMVPDEILVRDENGVSTGLSPGHLFVARAEHRLFRGLHCVGDTVQAILAEIHVREFSVAEKRLLMEFLVESSNG